MLEEGVEVPVSAVKELEKAVKIDTDETANDSATAQSDVNMQHDKNTAEGSGAGTENGAPDPEDKPVRMDTDAKVRQSFMLAVVICERVL